MPSELRKPSTRGKSNASLALTSGKPSHMSIARASPSTHGSIARSSVKPSHMSLAKFGSLSGTSLAAKPSRTSVAKSVRPSGMSLARSVKPSRTSLAKIGSVNGGSIATKPSVRVSLAKSVRPSGTSLARASVKPSHTSLARVGSTTSGSLARASTKPSHMSVARQSSSKPTFQSVAELNKSMRESQKKSIKGPSRSSGITSLKPSGMAIDNKQPSGARFTLASIDPELMPIAESIIRSSAATDRPSKTFQSVADGNKSIRESQKKSLAGTERGSKTFQSIADENKSKRESKMKSLAAASSASKSFQTIAEDNRSKRESKLKSLAGTDPSFGGKSKTFQSVAEENKSKRESKLASGVKSLKPSGVSMVSSVHPSRASTRRTLDPSVRASMLKSINPSILTFNTESARPSVVSTTTAAKPSGVVSGIKSLLPSRTSAGRSAVPSHISLAKSYASSGNHSGSVLPRSLNPSIHQSIRESSTPSRVSKFTSGFKSLKPPTYTSVPASLDPSVRESIMEYSNPSRLASGNSLRPSGFTSIPEGTEPGMNGSIRPSYYASTTQSFMPSRMGDDMSMDQSYFSCDDTFMPSQMSQTGMSYNPSQTSGNFGNFQDDEQYDPEVVEIQEEMAEACFDNQKLLNDVFFKLAKEFERISDEIDGCIETSYKAFDMIDPGAVMNEDYFEEEYDEDLEDLEYREDSESVGDGHSVRFSHKTLVSDDLNNPEVIPFEPDPASTITQSQSRTQYDGSTNLSQGTSLRSKSRSSKHSTNPSIAKSIMTAQSNGGSKSVASINKAIASSIMSGKSLAETTKSVASKVSQRHKSIDASEAASTRSKSANPSMRTSGSRSLNQSLRSSGVRSSNPSTCASRARSLNQSLCGSRGSRSLNNLLRSSMGRSVTFKSGRQSLSRQSVAVDEPVSMYDSQAIEDEEPKSLGKSVMSGIKSIVSQGKSLLGGRSSSMSNGDGDVPNTSLSRMGSQSNASEGGKQSIMSRLSSKISSMMGSRRSSAEEGSRASGQSQNPSVLSKIKSFFTGSSNNGDEQEEYDVEEEEMTIDEAQERYIDLWGRVISKLEITSAQFKALSEMTKAVAMVPNEPFEIPIMEMPTHADGQPLSADELIHALHNTMIPNKHNQSKIHSLIINLIVAHCEIRNAETFLDELCQKIEIPPKHLKRLSANRVERTKLIVKQCGNELIATDSRYENYVNAYYEALEHNYPPALGTLDDPPLKHSPTCPSQVEMQRRMICEIREQYIRDKITAFNELVANWLIDYTTIAVETTENLAQQDNGL